MSEIKPKGDHYVLLIDGEEVIEGSYRECQEERENAGN